MGRHVSGHAARASARGTTQWLAATLSLCACTHDFSSFRFGEPAPVTRDDAGGLEAGTPSVPDAAEVRMTQSVPPVPSASDAGAADARMSDAIDARMSDAIDAQTVVTAPKPDAATKPDASNEGDDAQVPSGAEQCSQAWTAFDPSVPACGACACTQCESPVLDCLSRGTTNARALCSRLFACALAHKCHDWDCYCSSARCMSMPNPVGDGPCAEEMAAAAGGRDQVSAVHRANDPNQPLVRAVRAIGCNVGVPFGSVSGNMTGKCVSTCTR
jgi:hypothetical protein